MAIGEGSSIRSISTVCPSCRRRCTLGLLYCLYCNILLPGCKSRNIFHRHSRNQAGVVSDAGGNSLASIASGSQDLATIPANTPTDRKEDPEIAKLIATATLVTVAEKQKRGPSQRSDLQHRNPSRAFAHYCRELLRRLNRDGGLPLSEELGGHRVYFHDVPMHLKIRRRAELDHDRFPHTTRKAISDNHRDSVSDQAFEDMQTTEGFLRFCDHMNRVALDTWGVNWNPMTRDDRDTAPPKKRLKGTVTNSDSGTSIPRANLPGYSELRRGLTMENREVSSARVAAVRTAKPKSAAIDRSDVPSDGLGCDICGGSHYARDCPRPPQDPNSRRQDR